MLFYDPIFSLLPKAKDYELLELFLLLFNESNMSIEIAKNLFLLQKKQLIFFWVQCK